MNSDEQLQQAMQRMPELVSGKLCLDFANTVEPRGGSLEQHRDDTARSDYLTSYIDLVAWVVHAHLLSEQEALQLLQEQQQHTRQGHDILRRAIALREVIYHSFWMIAHKQLPEARELELLKREYLETLSHATLEKVGESFVWQWTTEKGHMEYPVWPIVQSAMGLLMSEDLKRIKVCPGVPGDPVACAWLFYDESKNRTRQWCSMADCGSGAKARRLTERRRAARKKRSI